MTNLQLQLFGGAGDEGGIGFPGISDVDVELEFIVIGVEDIEAMGNVVIGGADDSDSGAFKFGIGSHQLIISRADFEPDMIEAWLPPKADQPRAGGLVFWDSVYLEKEELVMGAAARKKGHTRFMSGDFFESKGVFVKTPGTLEVSDEEDDMTEFMNMHRE